MGANKNNANAAERVTFKSESDGEFFVYAEHGQTALWRKDPATTPLVDVLQAFQIFEVDNGSHQGVALKPSKGKLANAFGTEDENEIIKRILTDGKIQATSTGHKKGGDFHTN